MAPNSQKPLITVPSPSADEFTASLEFLSQMKPDHILSSHLKLDHILSSYKTFENQDPWFMDNVNLGY